MGDEQRRAVQVTDQRDEEYDENACQCCGDPVVYVHHDLGGFCRGLCYRCDLLRCDAFPGACTAPPTPGYTTEYAVQCADGEIFFDTTNAETGARCVRDLDSGMAHAHARCGPHVVVQRQVSPWVPVASLSPLVPEGDRQ